MVADNLKSRALRDLYVFKIFVGLNPDGVVAGNSRTGAEGADLGRAWMHPDPELHPTISGALDVLREAAKKREIILFCDLHGNDRKCGTFMCGCAVKSGCSFSDWSRMHLVPRALGRLTPMFSYKDCVFDISQSKVHKPIKKENARREPPPALFFARFLR